jgi:hypothetical protein
MTRRYLTMFIAVALVAALPALAAGFKVERTGPCKLQEAPEAIRATLQAEGLRVTGDDGAAYELWMRATIPLKDGSTAADYSAVADGTFVGLIKYFAKGGDFRGQVIRPEVYLLRFQNILADGNHMGVSATPQFFVLTPPELDKGPAPIAGFIDLMDLCRKASRTNHPYTLYLTEPRKHGEPGFEKEDGHWYLEGKTKAAPSGGAEVDFPFAVVLVGKAEA